MRKLNDVCVGQSEDCLPQLASLHLGGRVLGGGVAASDAQISSRCGGADCHSMYKFNAVDPLSLDPHGFNP